MVVCDKEHISCSDDGMEAIVFTAQGNNQEYVKYFAPTKDQDLTENYREAFYLMNISNV